MPKASCFSGETFPLEMHKVRIIQKPTLLPVEGRLAAIEKAGYNTFLLENKGGRLAPRTGRRVSQGIRRKPLTSRKETDGRRRGTMGASVQASADLPRSMTTKHVREIHRAATGADRMIPALRPAVRHRSLKAAFDADPVVPSRGMCGLAASRGGALPLPHQ
jgi:hypothetical protein